MVEAAGIEPSLETDTIAALLAQNANTNHTREAACEDLIDTFHALSEQNRDTFLQLVCAIYVQWLELPPALGKAIEQWESLPDDIRTRITDVAQVVYDSDRVADADDSLLSGREATMSGADQKSCDDTLLDDPVLYSG